MKEVISEEFLNNIELLELIIRDNRNGLFGGSHRSKSYGSSCEFADYREYVPGDDIRRIDWSVFARFDKLYMRLYLDERQMHTRIYIDSSASMGYNGKNEMAIKIAAIVSYLSVKAMDKVSIYYIKGHQAYEVATNVVGKDNWMNCIGRLNEITYDGDSFISDAILESNVGYGDGMSLVISDFLTDNDYFKAIDHLRSKRRDVLFAQVLSPDELNPKYSSKFLFYDSENKNVTYRKNITKDVLKAYQQALSYITDTLELYLHARDSEYMLINSSTPLEEVVLRDMVQKEVVK